MINHISDLITEDNIISWVSEKPVVVNAGTGQGKSYFVINTLYNYLKKNNKRCLYLIPRTRIKEQFDIELQTKKDCFDLITYQQLEHDIKNHIPITQKYDYIVADECHYFTYDSEFNNFTDLSFNWILNQKNAIKIFMSATINSFIHYLLTFTPIYHSPINQPQDYSYIKSLTFFNDDEQIEEIINDCIIKNKKAIFFISSAEKAIKLYNNHKEYMIFSCSKNNPKYSKYVNEELIESIVEKQNFDFNILITTSVLDSGFTLKDKTIDTIVIDIFNPETVIQCVGRKRIIDNTDILNLYIRSRSNQFINGILMKKRNDLDNVKLFQENEEDYHLKNERQNDNSGIIINTPIKTPDNTQHYIKSYNFAKYCTNEYMVYNLLPEILSLGDFGYCKYLARHFGFYDDETKTYSYNTISNEKYDLIEYLDSIIGIDMFTPKERTELIKKFHITDCKGKLIKNIDVINEYLKSENLPYIIASRRKTKVINKVKKNFKSVWTVVKI